MSKRDLVLYISMSLDGYLATKDDDLSWLSCVEVKGEDYGYAEFTKDVDTYIVGRQTYDVVRSLTGGQFPQGQQYKCYVITRQEREPENGVSFYKGDLEDLVKKLKQEEGGKIYCDGGGQIVQLLMAKDLIDEYIISVIPTILGVGKRLFIGGTPPLALEAGEVKQYKSGLIQLKYKRKKT